MAAKRRLRILNVHGIGQHPPGGEWEKEWSDAVRAPLARVAPDTEPVFEFVHYDDLFEKHSVGFFDTVEALAKLGASAVTAPFRARGMERGLSSTLRWTAGMVVKWVESDRFRRETRARLATRLARFTEEDPTPPDLVLAHSLGSLITYDTLTTLKDAPLAKARLVTFGSQIANPFVSGQFLAGRVEVPKGLASWTHLYNPEDAAFAAPIRLADARFEQLTTFFDEPGMLDHSAPRYLAHPAAEAGLWADFGAPASVSMRGLGAAPASPRRARPSATRKTSPKRRALLVGINEYPNEEDRLEGCVNDVFLMSSLLQESGYAAEDIRVVLDKRATTKGIRDRLEWLLDGVDASDTEGDDPAERVFYYSGHGAQLPTYGAGDKVDRMDETLVPWDFDWSPEHAFTDDAFHDLYAQLPYGLRFLTVFDCCHSGGMTRDGGPRVRGLAPPDDIRHRALRWNAEVEMWEERDFAPTNEAFLDDHTERAREHRDGPRKELAGRMTTRLGYSMGLRGLDARAFGRRRKELGHRGPYMPLLVYACREDEVAMEYRHGAVAHGAFTYSFVKNVRDRRKGPAAGRRPTFEALVKSVRGDLAKLGYDQHPVLAGPTVARTAVVPFEARRGRATPR